MSVKPIILQKFDGGLNLTTSTTIGDNQFTIAKNVFYNTNRQLETRRGYTTFGSAVGTNKPITSYFSFQNDSTGAVTSLCASGTAMYKLDNTLKTRSSIGATITEFETATGKTSWRTRWDFAVYKNVIYMCNGVDHYMSYNGTTYTEFTGQPKYRYINMNTDVLYGSGEDLNPITMYYSNTAPADGSVIDTNAVVVGGDEGGKINGMNEFGKIILAMKSNKIYGIDIVNEKADAIDSQTGGFSDRTIANIGNTLVYLTERGVDSLQQRYTSAGASTLESTPIDEDVRELTTKIEEFNYNANCAWYIKKLNNYYFTFDTNNDNIPDTTLVYNSLVNAWTQYTYPAIYDYGYYVDTDGTWRYVFAPATTDQMYEFESGFDDNGTTISYEIETKAFDFGDPGQAKTYEYVDVIGQKARGTQIYVDIKVEGDVVGGAIVDDTKIVNTISTQALGTRPIGLDSLTGDIVDDVPMYNFMIRIPMYSTGTNVSVNMHSEGGIWILEKIKIGVNGEPVDVFNYGLIG